MSVILVQEGDKWNVYLGSILHEFDTEEDAIEFLEELLARIRG